MDEAKRQQLIGAYVAAYNAFDVDAMSALLAPEVCFENYSGTERTHVTRGIAEFWQLAMSSKAMFSEREQKVVALAWRADSVLASIEFKGRLAADIPDGPARGTVLAMTGTSEFEFASERISKVVDRA